MEEDCKLIDQLIPLLTRIGASPEQAVRMAPQLIKRARQLSQERGVSEAQALQHLLSLFQNHSG
jgi:hypothetical protein